MKKVVVKEQAELRHILAHLTYAIHAAANGHPEEAQYEIDQIEGLIFWDGDKEMTKHLKRIKYGR